MCKKIKELRWIGLERRRRRKKIPMVWQFIYLCAVFLVVYLIYRCIGMLYISPLVFLMCINWNMFIFGELAHKSGRNEWNIFLFEKKHKFWMASRFLGKYLWVFFLMSQLATKVFCSCPCIDTAKKIKLQK